jgi:hypothetical protein
MTLQRGSNPVWLFDDLTGNLLDDTHYLFVLQNDIPYLPAIVYQDAAGAVAWSNPIQFLANGTLPVNIFFDSTVTYRLEVRAGNTQSDALIYLVEDYSPGGSGGSVTTGSIAADNQITNPQFALKSFQDSLSVSAAGTYEVAPGWSLVLVGTGTAVVTREALTNTSENPTNAPYMLNLVLVGWSSAYLRQRFNENGMLWAGKNVANSITAKLTGANAFLSSTLVDSNATLLATLLPSTTQVTSTYAELTGTSLLPATTNPDTPPAAYIEYRLNIPGSINLSVSSLQLIESDTEVRYVYEQDTIERQIDHTYNTAYPIIPVGTVIDYVGFGTVDHYLVADGTNTYNRVTYSQLFNVLTTTETVAISTGVATFTVVDSTDYWIGMGIEGDGVTSGTVISGIAGTTITMDNVGTDTGNFEVRFFAAAFGDSAATFAVPDLQDYVLAGAGGSLFGTTLNGIGAKGGSATHTLLAAQLPPHSHTYSHLNSNVAGSAGGSSFPIAFSSSNTGNGPGTSDPFNIVQQTALARKLIRFE